MKENKQNQGVLYLIPNTLGSESTEHIIPVEVAQIMINLRNFAVEDVKSARRVLRKLDRSFPIDDSNFVVINKKSDSRDCESLIRLLKQGEDVGILSDAGCAGIADPGAILVSAAHEVGIKVSACVGPSSILLCLISSGFNGQQFRFHGYLPKDQKERIRAIKELEMQLKRSGETQLFMDTPFRNLHVLEDLLNVLSDSTKLCLASNLTLPNEDIRTMTAAEWRENAYDLSKVNVMFAIGR
jgi:16S rRNA (cytidine1402-2'-O)-methyltransferase